MGNIIPFPEHIPAPRACFQCGKAKQAIGMSYYNLFDQFDNLSRQLLYPQRPLASTKIARFLGFDELPSGQNVTVAFMAYSYNQEDAIIINKTAVQRGLFLSATRKTLSIEENKDENKISMFREVNKIINIRYKIKSPDTKRRKVYNKQGVRNTDYSKLDTKTGIVKPFYYVKNKKKMFYLEEGQTLQMGTNLISLDRTCKLTLSSSTKS